MIKVEVCKHCNGHARDTKGVDILEEIKKYENLLKEKGINLELLETGCLGPCKSPVARINGEIYTSLDSEKLKEIFKSFK